MKRPEDFGFTTWKTLLLSLNLSDLNLIEDSLIVKEKITLRELKILVIKEIIDSQLDKCLRSRVYLACQAANVLLPNGSLFTQEELLKIYNYF